MTTPAQPRRAARTAARCSGCAAVRAASQLALFRMPLHAYRHDAGRAAWAAPSCS